LEQTNTDIDEIFANPDLAIPTTPTLLDTTLPSMPPPLPLLRNTSISNIHYDIHRMAQLPIDYPNNKISIVKKALMNTYEFIDKLKSTKNNKKIDLILVLFNNCAEIFSTIDLPADKQPYELISSVNKCKFKDVKNIIEQSIFSCGGTNFYAVKQANKFIDSNFSTLKSIKYLLSDGYHNTSIQYPTERITEEHIKFNYSLGIGHDTQYDKLLMENMADNFVQGNDEYDVYDSIIGDTFGSVSIFAKNVEINIYTTANEIKSSKSVISVNSNVEIDKSLFVSTDKSVETKLKVSNINNNTIRINCNNSIDFYNVDKDLLFIFYVDVSGSMADMIVSNLHPASNIIHLDDLLHNSSDIDLNEELNGNLNEELNGNLNEELNGNLNEELNGNLNEELDKKLDEIIITAELQEIMDEFVEYYENPTKRSRVDELIYNKFVLSTIDKFNTFNEEYFICNSNDPIYVEIKTQDNIYRFVCNVDNKENTYLSHEMVDLVNKYCNLMFELNGLKQLSREDRKKSIDDLSMLVKSPEYVIAKESIDEKSNKSQIDMYFLASINQILRLHNKSNIHSNCLDYVITTSDLSIARNVSSTTSRQYSSGITETIYDTKQIVLYDLESSMCTICTLNPKSVLYDCGHCIACKMCTEQMFFANTVPYEQIHNLRMKTESIDKAIKRIETKDIYSDQEISITTFEKKIKEQLVSCPKSCPLCRKDIKHIKLIKSVTDTGIKCCQDKCLNFANYVSSNCNHVIYCKICWKNNIRSSTNGTMVCPCGVPITKYIEIFT